MGHRPCCIINYMDVNDIENQLLSWASKRDDIQAIVRIGSRAQTNSRVDQWSDWDYHLICKSTNKYLNYDWHNVFQLQIWNINEQLKTIHNSSKVSIIFENAYECDLVLLTAWQIKIIYNLMRHPSWWPRIPPTVHKGILDLRRIVKPGFVLLKGDKIWEERMRASLLDLDENLSFKFHHIVTSFWKDAIWIYKQIAREDYRTAIRTMHLGLFENIYVMLEIEAMLNKKKYKLEARQAEQWMSENRLHQTNIMTAPNKESAINALISLINTFDEVSKAVASQALFTMQDYTALKTWLINGCKELLCDNNNLTKSKRNNNNK